MKAIAGELKGRRLIPGFARNDSGALGGSEALALEELRSNQRRMQIPRAMMLALAPFATVLRAGGMTVAGGVRVGRRFARRWIQRA